jgi:hypothetical protein
MTAIPTDQEVFDSLAALPEIEQIRIDKAIRANPMRHKRLFIVVAAARVLPFLCPVVLFGAAFIWARSLVGYGLLGGGGVILGVVASRKVLNAFWPHAYANAVRDFLRHNQLNDAL